MRGSSATWTTGPGHDRRYSLDDSKLRGLGLAAGALARGRPRRDGRVVPREPHLVGADQVRRVPRVLRAAVRRAARLALLRGPVKDLRGSGQSELAWVPQPVVMPVRRLALALVAVAALFGPAAATPQGPAAGERDHLRDHRPRLGPRRRDAAVGRVRLRPARVHLRQDPRPLLPRNHPRGRAGSQDQGAAGRLDPEDRSLFAGSLHGRRRRRDQAPDRRRQLPADARPEGEARARRARGGAARAAPLRRGHEPPLAGAPLARRPDRRRQRQERSPSSTTSRSTRTRAGSSRTRCRRTGRSRRSRHRRSPRAPMRSPTSAAPRSTCTPTRATRSTAGSRPRRRSATRRSPRPGGRS